MSSLVTEDRQTALKETESEAGLGLDPYAN